jgi:hypothetical protein
MAGGRCAALIGPGLDYRAGLPSGVSTDVQLQIGGRIGRPAFPASSV